MAAVRSDATCCTAIPRPGWEGWDAEKVHESTWLSRAYLGCGGKTRTDDLQIMSLTQSLARIVARARSDLAIVRRYA